MLKTLKLRNMRVKEQKNLNENNLFLYKYITKYIKATDLTMYEKEEILHQIMDMLLEAQYENRDKSFIVGDDYKKFCDNIIQEYMVTKSKLYIILDYIQRYIIWMSLGVMGDAIYNFLSRGQLTITLNDIMTWNMFALIIVFVSKSITREAVLVPISGRSKIKMNFNFNQNSKAMNWYFGIVVISLLIQIFVNHVFNIDSYNYFISLSNYIFIILPLIFVVLIGISIYKVQYNRR